MIATTITSTGVLHGELPPDLAEYAEGRQVLNCFAYTGAFGVFALKGGAAVTNVEASSAALELARRNAALNGFGYRDDGKYSRCD